MSNTYSLQISRNSNQEITLQVRDNLSDVQFLEIKLTLEQFALAVTGMNLHSVVGEVRGLEGVGKTKMCESRCVKLPKIMYNKPNSKISRWLIEEFKEGGEIYEPDGWILDSYVGKHSFTYQNGVVWLNYIVYKYVETKDCKTES